MVALAAPAQAAVTASVVSGELRVRGDAQDDQIALRLSADGLRVEVRNLGLLVGSFLRSTFTAIDVDAGRGADSVLVDEVNGAFTHLHATTIQGNEGDDTITGGAGAETLLGGPNADTITGGRGADTILGGAGDDTIIWNANAPLMTSTDGADTVDGEAGDDTLEVYGNALGESYGVAPSSDRVLVSRSTTQLSVGTTEELRFVLDAGNDTFTADDQVTTPISVSAGDGDDVVDGGGGDDALYGEPGNDTLRGGPGRDTLNGLGGVDQLEGDDGDDTLLLYFTQGPDTFVGGPGTDTLLAIGFGAAENVALTPSPGQNVFMTVDGVQHLVATTERLELSLQGGDDVFTSQPGLTSLTTLDIDAGSGNDQITGGDGNDTLSGGIDGDDVLDGGAGNDTLTGFAGDDILFGRDGDDTIDAGLGSDVIFGGAGNDTIDGGADGDAVNGDGGNDVLTGGAGNDSLFGGTGDDTLTGGDGIDTVHGGAGDDLIRYAVTDADEVIDGDDGIDTLRFDGALLVDSMAMGPNGSRASLSWSNMSPPGAILDLGSVERFDIATGGNGDGLTILPGLAALVQQITLDLGDHGDTLQLTPSSPPVIADGGPGAPDRLRFDAQGQSVHLQPGSISTQGVVRVTHTNFEEVTILNPAGTLPTVTITTPSAAPSMTSTSAFVTLAGTVTDDGSILSVTWTNDRGGSGTAAGTTAWTAADIPLRAGPNRITVSALDATGNLTFDTIDVTVSALTYSLAEGATGAFFDLDVLIANPTATPAPVTVTFLRENATTVTQSLTLAPTSRTTLHVDEIPGLEDVGGVSTVVTSTSAVPLVVERTMFWDASGYGSHGGTAVDGPQTRWLFAEGSEGFFNTFVLLANAGTSPSTATLTFLREGSTPFTRIVNVPPTSRVTIAANGIPELVGRSFSIVVDATLPIIAERAMYFGVARAFDGGHESAGVPAGATSWFLAEGATGGFFTTFVLVGNPNPAPATVTFTFLTGSGQTVTRTRTVPANGRLTVNIATEDPILADAAVATTVTADVPIVAERAMYWPGPPTSWAEAHNSFGATTLGTRWALAEGRAGGSRGFQTYILLANPSPTAANVTVTFLRADGSTVVRTYVVNPTSRFNVDVSAVPELANETFGTLIEVTNGVGIGVERAMYSNALGQFWAAGTNALGTRVP